VEKGTKERRDEEDNLLMAMLKTTAESFSTAQRKKIEANKNSF
jgi:hypothetical protein